MCMASSPSRKSDVMVGAHDSFHFFLFLSVEHKASSSVKVKMGEEVLNVRRKRRKYEIVLSESEKRKGPEKIVSSSGNMKEPTWTQ